MNKVSLSHTMQNMGEDNNSPNFTLFYRPQQLHTHQVTLIQLNAIIIFRGSLIVLVWIIAGLLTQREGGDDLCCIQPPGGD